jgi:hypothetical protein
VSEEGAGAEYVAIALASAAVLLFETLVTRVLSVTLQYHFAFLAISLAMLGLGAPGVWYSIWPPGARAVRVSLFASAVALPASVLAIVKLGAVFRGSITLFIVALLAPLLALGSAVCALLVRAKGRRVARMYAADLLGASLGAVAVVPLLQGIPTPPLIAALALLPLVAVVLVSARGRAVTISAALLAALIAGLIVWKRPFHLHYNKIYDEVEEPLYEKWTPTARVSVFPQDQVAGGTFYGWGMGRHFVPPEPDGLWLDQDGSAGTPILHWARGTPVPSFLYYDVTSVPYQLGRRLGRVAIVGGGGGRDILTAYGRGAGAIDVIELNSYIAGAVRNEFAPYSGDPYGLPGVHTTIGEGRSVLTAGDERYDLIQISLIDTFAATAAGAYALSENGLYTVEAFRLYLQRLAPSGVASMTRWIDGPSVLEAPRLVLVAREALAREGVADPLAHLLVLRAGWTANVLAFRSPVDEETLARADRLATERGFERLWPPGPTDSVVASALVAGPEFFARGGFDVRPTTDDRPFFFQTANLLSPPPPEVREHLTSGDPALLLRRIVLVLAAITGTLLFAPLALMRRWPKSEPSRVARGTAYFALIGVAFMLFEIPLILRMTLYLGHPSRGAAVVLGALLLGAGVGAGRIAKASPERTVVTLAVMPFVALAATLALGPLAATTLAWPLALRVAVALAVLSPLGFAMGAPFPAGMIRFEDVDRSWLWAVNGASSVLASAAALAVAMVIGLTGTMIAGSVAYLAAWIVWARSRPVDAASSALTATQPEERAADVGG